MMQWIGNDPDNDGQLQFQTHLVPHVQVVSLLGPNRMLRMLFKY